MDQMFSWMLMEYYIDLRETKRLLEVEAEAHEREQLIFMWPVPSKGGRLGDDGCQGEVGWKEGKRET